ncbi:MAG: hypothetical protein EPN88_07205 [Bacteroidetes bacterium]|nr:MAG: hypothetical protein EPN88_07205 [Bacteroidota bacterium]
MKTKLCNPLILIGLFLIVVPCPGSFGQDSTSQKSQMLDLKLQLLDSKLELLDTKIKLWEAKPKELDIKLSELNSRISSMDFDPQLMTKKMNKMDSLFKEREEIVRTVENQPPVVAEQESEPEFVPDYKSSIMLDPVRLLEGTFCLSYERVLNSRFSLNVGGMVTYSTTQGLSNYYFTNQSFAYLDNLTHQYNSYNGEVMSGGGLNIQFRNYLLANHPNRQKAPLGLYAAPQIMFRKMTITGNYQKLEETDPGVFEMVNKKVIQHLNIFAGGVILGLKVPLFKVLTVDLFAGGNIKLSKYKNEDSFTKYKDWFNIDFSGVSPVAGIAIGILK